MVLRVVVEKRTHLDICNLRKWNKGSSDIVTLPAAATIQYQRDEEKYCDWDSMWLCPMQLMGYRYEYIYRSIKESRVQVVVLL